MESKPQEEPAENLKNQEDLNETNENFRKSSSQMNLRKLESLENQINELQNKIEFNFEDLNQQSQTLSQRFYIKSSQNATQTEGNSNFQLEEITKRLNQKFKEEPTFQNEDKAQKQRSLVQTYQSKIQDFQEDEKSLTNDISYLFSKQGTRLIEENDNLAQLSQNKNILQENATSKPGFSQKQFHLSGFDANLTENSFTKQQPHIYKTNQKQQNLLSNNKFAVPYPPQVSLTRPGQHNITKQPVQTRHYQEDGPQGQLINQNYKLVSQNMSQNYAKSQQQAQQIQNQQFHYQQQIQKNVQQKQLMQQQNIKTFQQLGQNVYSLQSNYVKQNIQNPTKEISPKAVQLPSVHEKSFEQQNISGQNPIIQINQLYPNSLQSKTHQQQHQHNQQNSNYQRPPTYRRQNFQIKNNNRSASSQRDPVAEMKLNYPNVVFDNAAVSSRVQGVNEQNAGQYLAPKLMEFSPRLGLASVSNPQSSSKEHIQIKYTPSLRQIGRSLSSNGKRYLH